MTEIASLLQINYRRPLQEKPLFKSQAVLWFVYKVHVEIVGSKTLTSGSYLNGGF